jgi:hypothetical protein
MQEPRSQAGGNQARRRHRDRGNSLKVSRDLIVLEGLSQRRYHKGLKPKADEALESETVDVQAAKQPS